MDETKRRKWKRWLPRLGIVFTAGFVLLNFVAYHQAWSMMHFENGKSRTRVPEKLTFFQKIKVLLLGVNLPRPTAEIPIASLRINAQVLKIPGNGAITLGAWYCPAASNEPLVILFHGYAAEKSSLVPEARAFLEMGCAVLLVDFRGSGQSSESYTTIGYFEADDVAAAVNYARKNFARTKVVLYGSSMGGAAVMRAVACCDVKPDAIIVEAVFDTLLNTIRHRFEAMRVPSFPAAQLLEFWGGEQAGFNGFKHNPVDYAQKIGCPILFLHGTADMRAHLEDAQRVYDAVPGAKQFKAFPGVPHAETLRRAPDEWKKTVRQFLNEADGLPGGSQVKPNT